MIFQNQDTIYACVVHVGELIGLATKDKSGLIPSGGYIRADLEDYKWYCLFETENRAANVVKVQSMSYQNQIPVDVTIRFYVYDGGKKFEYKINGSTTSSDFETKMKYKYDGGKYKVWIKSGYISAQFLNMDGLTNVLVLNDPDSDAIDMVGE